MQTSHKLSRLLPLLCVALLAFGSSLFAQSAGSIAAEWPARVSGEFAFYRDYTFADPAWTGVLFYDEETWAVQVFFPESGKRVASFFSVKAEGDKLSLTGQRNDPNLQNEDVPLVNYLMQVLPLLWEARHDVEIQGVEASAKRGKKSIFPPEVSLQKSAPLFGGEAEFAFAAQLPLFGLKSVTDAAGREVFAFESGGRISADNSDAFFAFEPVPQSARKSLAELQKGQGKKTKKPKRGKKEAAEIVPVAENFFLVGDEAAIVTGSGNIGPLSEKGFYAAVAKNFLLSGGAGLLPVPQTFEWASEKRAVWLTQVLYTKDEKKLMRKRMLIKADFAGGKYSFAEVTCFESAFAQNKARFEEIAQELIGSK